MPASFLREITSAVPSALLQEVTLECAPGTVSSEKIRVWRACGINRISLGVQSFVTTELRQTGRRHDAAVVEREVDALREAGLSNINVDLIAGLPGQNRDSWEQSLDWIERLQPPHVSLYILEVDEDSRLGNEILLGGIRYGATSIPDDDLTAELYERGVERLAATGIARYEISNFALPGFESRHNLKYWLLEPYLGFGLDAHSFDGARRWSNPDTIDEYLAPHANFLSATDAAEEHFFVGLRLTNGIEPTSAEWQRFAEPIDKWIDEGMLIRHGARLRLSDRGVLVSNEIFQEFLNA